MKLFKKIAAVILGCIALLNGFGLAGCGEKGDDMMKNAPDYSNSEYKLDMYAHCSPSNGHYTDKYGKPQYAGEDFRTEERFQEYKDMGLDTLLLLPFPHG